MAEIVLREAQIEDMQRILPHIVEFKLDCENLKPEQFIIAEIDKNLAGFGRIKPYPDMYELSTIGVVKAYREKGIGRKLINYLIKIFPSDEIWITTKVPEYFTKFGFRPSDNPPEEISQKCHRVCKSFDEVNEGSVYMVLTK